MKTVKKVNSGRGGSVLLAKHGSEYFSNLKKKSWEKQKIAREFYETEMAKKKSAKPAKVSKK